MAFTGATAIGLSLSTCTRDRVEPSIEFAPLEKGLYIIDEQIDIQWKADNIDYLELAVSRDAQETWEIIAARLDATIGRFIWDIDRASDINLFRLRAVGRNEIVSFSGSFSIVSGVIVDLTNFNTLNMDGDIVTTNVIGIGEVAILRNGESEYVVINLSCPHQGCTVAYVPRARRFDCPCHDGSFTKRGCLIKAPVQESLKVHESIFNSQTNELTIFRTDSLPSC